MTARIFSCGMAIAVTLLHAGVAGAQGRPAPAVEVLGGWAGFADEGLINHSVLGGAARVHLTPRVSVGPEVTYMVGPGTDSDTFLLGNVFFDFRAPRGGRPPAVTPFVVAGAGLFQHRMRFAAETFTHTSVGVAVGGGVRVSASDRVYIAPDVRLGGEDPHLRATLTVGVRLAP